MVSKIKNYIIRLIKEVDRRILFNFLYKLKQKFLSLRSKLHLSKIEYKFNLYYEKKVSTLSLLCDEHQCDKGYFNLSKRIFFRDLHPHTYADFYSLLFDHCRNDVKKVFECGIGTNNPALPSSMGTQYKPGASLRVWKDYFPKAIIYGGDVDKNILFEEERIKTFEVDQLNQYSIQKMWNNIKENNFDPIIDDGLHTYDAGVILFNNSYSMLRNGGLYVIEDVHPSYLYKLSNFFIKNYETQIITLKSRSRKLLEDNNIILIRKK